MQARSVPRCATDSLNGGRCPSRQKHLSPRGVGGKLAGVRFSDPKRTGPDPMWQRLLVLLTIVGILGCPYACLARHTMACCAADACHDAAPPHGAEHHANGLHGSAPLPCVRADAAVDTRCCHVRDESGRVPAPIPVGAPDGTCLLSKTVLSDASEASRAAVRALTGPATSPAVVPPLCGAVPSHGAAAADRAERSPPASLDWGAGLRIALASLRL